MISHTDLLTILHYNQSTGDFTWKVSRGKAKKGSVAGYRHHSGYLIIRAYRRGYLAHRLAWFYVYGVWPNEQIDHIDCDCLNNRIDNLREATPQENSSNLKSRRGGKKGVCWHKQAKKWQAAIKHKGKNYYLGLFSSENEAHNAYCKAAQRMHSDFWRAA